MKPVKSGYTVSYLLPGSNRVLANLVCRKIGMKIRLYPQKLRSYEIFLDTLPTQMKREIQKAGVCKRILDSAACNPKCVMGYSFHMDGVYYQKCRYMAFMPALNAVSAPYIIAFLEKEPAHFK